MNLPQDFLDEMKLILKDDFQQYIGAVDKEPFRGISVNRIKITPEKLIPLLPFAVQKSPFYDDGYYIPINEQGIGKHPLHHAGSFYVQEPSASSAVSLLDVQPGEKVLDLCAAPGGKSIQIASKLSGTGLIWSNEVVRNRAQILLSNFERMGVANGVVSSCYPEVLCEKLGSYFDKVLVDAPCSGEGMFRKNPAASLEWSREHVQACANRQLSILDSAAQCVRPGGVLVYSTCTFSYEENEGVIKTFLAAHPDFEESGTRQHFGRQTELSCAVRITPLEGGEGHFAARLRRKGNDTNISIPVIRNHHLPKASLYQAAEKMLFELYDDLPEGILSVNKNKVYLLPHLMPDINGLGVVRAGVLVGEYKKNRIEPAHALFMSSRPSSLRQVLSLEQNDKRVDEFLSGMEIECDAASGYTAVLYCGVVIGFGKCSNGRLKNKYPKGIRQTAGSSYLRTE